MVLGRIGEGCAKGPLSPSGRCGGREVGRDETVATRGRLSIGDECSTNVAEVREVGPTA